MPPYISERQTEYWTSRAVEDFLWDAGFEVETFPLTAVAERDFPVDFLYHSAAFGKLFGFQYKPLYKNGRDYWPINQRQLRDLKMLGDWVFYSLSELKTSRDYRLALHRQLIVKPESVPNKRRVTHGELKAPRYYRWGGFYSQLERCTIGKRVSSRDDVLKTLTPLLENHPRELRNAVDVFSINFETREVTHLSPYERDLDLEPDLEPNFPDDGDLPNAPPRTEVDVPRRRRPRRNQTPKKRKS